MPRAVGRSTHRRFHVWLVERARSCAAPPRARRCGRPRLGQRKVLVDRRGLVLHRLAQQRPACSTKSVSRFARGRSSSSSRTNDARRSTSGCRAQPAGVQQRLHGVRELCRRHPRDVLPVHPVELLGVEHRVAAADAFERERSRSARRRDISSRSSPGDQPSSARKFTIASGR